MRERVKKKRNFRAVTLDGVLLARDDVDVVAAEGDELEDLLEER